ncbi:hypothetical protein ASPWEDRAFT_22444 [Aspergillus wentii DTO 134E9]|uniref:SWI/SNF family DNA-dependent ATPase Ris1 n=1 Tax=Aspergillus wentii DTO 134E9 TaxID=1073089 RepID=A0A1L9RZL1_ASPWE|nr:uncharacterized protein ASPWEDRAFT_22444 [Aspergillus wentii DTO 134E9]KAI9932674.1 hypothetical protein MW887_008923 [Aspergillus wentii]OJJ40248.1 hypothetical protein ASPWEDRAFT_22444 [Aspergillus wentii DTO 134E9]
MSTLPPDPSTDEIMDDLQLHHVILQSLDEQRPGSIAEREEILDVIKDLEARLAERRVEQPRINSQTSPSPHPSLPGSDMSHAQLDGGIDSSPFDSPAPPRWGGQSAAMPAPSRMPQLRYRADWNNHAQTQGPLSIRKRTRDDVDFSDGPEQPSKRVTSHLRSLSSSPLSTPRSSQMERLGQDFGDSADDELHRILGLDSRDTLLELQEEQRKAEEYLAERKEQERRDEEYARRLTEGLYEQSRPESARSSSTAYSGSSLPFPTVTSPTNGLNQREALRLPSLHQTGLSSMRSNDLPRPTFGQPSLPGMNQARHRQPPSTPFRDSDDSDVAEITPHDFRRHHAPPAFRPREIYPKPGSPPAMYVPSQPFGGEASGFRGPGQFPPSYPSLGPVPGPSSIRDPGPMYGPNVLQNTMARLNAGRNLLENAGRSLYGGFPGPLPSSSPFDNFVAGRLPDLEFDQSIMHLNDLYESGGDPKKINEEIKQLLENIRPDSELTKENREGTPEALRYPLLEHQKLGLTWMKSMEESEQKGGILADDMGLGKTVQAIALMVSNPSTDPERRPTLIIAPVSLMQQWKREVQRMLKSGRHQLSVYVLHGDKRSAGYKDVKNYDVVLTTFGTLSSELKRKEKYDELQKSGANEQALSREMLHTLPVLGPHSKWHRVIIDEAQCIKNRNTKSALACCRINTTYRWCMSGTPMMNNVEELHSLLKFLRIRPYNNLERFNTEFTRPLKSGSAANQEKAMKQLQVLLKAVLLRRTKYSKIDGKPILQLPERISEKVHAVFSEDEQALYTALETRTQLQFNRYLQAGTVGRNYSNVLVLLLRLRQACCHPHLITDFSVETNANTDELDLVANAKAFGEDVIVRLRDNEDMECPICIDAVDNPIIFFPCGHSTCAECFSRISDPSLSVQQGHDGSVEVKCPNCRGKVDPKKITDHVSFKKVHFPDPSEEEDPIVPLKPAPEAEDDSDDDDSDDEGLTRFIVNDDEESGSSKSKGKMAKKPKRTLADLKKEASKNQKSKRKYLRRLEKTWIPSAKIEKTLELLQAAYDRGEGEKTIIFSQFTSLLDFLEVPIVRRGWGYRRYDGSMKPADRNSAVLDFTDNPDCRIMLVSLKAGNSGLNLVAASQVIIFDPFWNPYIEEQAIDRAHRIGQLREVHVHRILVQNTVEDRILELQDKKRELIEGALDEKAGKNVSRLGTRELAYLFGVN